MNNRAKIEDECFRGAEDQKEPGSEKPHVAIREESAGFPVENHALFQAIRPGETKPVQRLGRAVGDGGSRGVDDGNGSISG